jgi:aspartate carbamoyltransferase catalytic subunit
MNLSVKNLIGIKDLSVNDINLIFESANDFKSVINRPIKKVPTLRDLTIANVFFENSTRTKLSFELAQKRLSADIINFSSTNSSVNKGESLIDTIKNIISMKIDMVVIRHPNVGVPHLLKDKIESVIINAGDGTHEHPTQALLDAFTIKENLGKLKDKKILLVGDIIHSRVALSNIFLFKKLGAEVKVCGPKSLIPKYVEKLGVTYESSLESALRWCDVASMLRIQNERMNQSFFPTTREYSRDFGLDSRKLKQIDKEIIITHPGPINRGVELSSDIIDSGKTVILDQVENGVAIRMAVMYLLASRL